MEHEGRTHWSNPGTIALVLAILGYVLAKLTLGSLANAPSRTLAGGIAAIVLVLELAAAVLGVLALVRSDRMESRAKQWYGGIAIVLASIFLLGTLAGFLRGGHRSNEARESRVQEAERIGQDAVLEYPGWLGVVEALGAKIVVTSVHDDSPASKELNSYWKKNVSLVFVGIQPAGGDTDVSIDPSSLRLILADGLERRCLPTVEVYRTARKEKETWLALGDVRASAGETLAYGWAFFPRGTDFSRVESVVISVNGEDIVVQGAFLSSAQKKEPFSLGQEMRRAADR